MTPIDLRAPGWRDTLIDHLAATGRAMTTGCSDRAALHAVAQQLITVRWHPLNDDDGITTLADTGDQRPGWGAHANVELPPHTDGSAVADPPRLIMVTCIQPAETGGESWFIDGRDVYRTLAADYPAELKALARPGGTVFNGYRSSVFEHHDGRVIVRCRFDDLVDYSEAAGALPVLRDVIAQHTETVSLKPGDGYIIDNSRWIHGRAGFSGDRVMLRALGDLIPDIAGRLPRGFDAPLAAASNPFGSEA